MDQRPINIDVLRYRFPATAIASILHRISGVVLFLALPLLLWMLDQSLQSSSAFQALQRCLANNGMRFLLWLIISAALYHLIAGIRHLLMDLGLGEEKLSGRITAYLVIIITVLLSVVAGCWLW